MNQVQLGTSGLRISQIVLGCMSFGDSGSGTHSWTFGIDRARPIVQAAVEAGVTTFDTANVYSLGTSEEITGQLLREFTTRENVVIATKVNGRMHAGTNGAGLSRGAIMTQIDASLRRLGTDYVDLYQIHQFDPRVPIEETMEALHDVVRAGKARYIGASSMRAYQFAKMQHAADLGGWTRFVSMQDQYNLLMREEEREMFPYCAEEGVGVIPWSPLARGRLTRDWNDSTERSEQDAFGKTLYHQSEVSDRQIVDAVASVAGKHGVSRAQVALAWVIGNDTVTAPIVGVTAPHHLTDAVAAADLQLDDEDVELLESHYLPREPEGY